MARTTKPSSVILSDCLVDDLVLEDEDSLRHVALYADLKQVLRGAGYRFEIPKE